MFEFITSIFLTNIDLFALIYTLVVTPHTVAMSIGTKLLPECSKPSSNITCINSISNGNGNSYGNSYDNNYDNYRCDGNQKVYLLCTSQVYLTPSLAIFTILSVVLCLPLLSVTFKPWKYNRYTIDRIGFYVDYLNYRKHKIYRYYKYFLWTYIVVMLITALHYSIKNNGENKNLILHVICVAFNMILQTKDFFCETPTIVNLNNLAPKYARFSKFNDIIIQYLIELQKHKQVHKQVQKRIRNENKIKYIKEISKQ
jgi:hypothetical protein